MLKCIICGNEIISGMEICPECGFSVEVPAFLSPEQHKKWYDEIVVPAKEQWQKKVEEQLKNSEVCTKIADISENSSEFASAGIDFYAVVNQDKTVSLFGNTGIAFRKAKSAQDVRAVASGNSHIVLLKSNGTVESYGKNSVGQCDVSGWKNIAQIAVSGDTTVAVTDDGKLLSAGAGMNEISSLMNKVYSNNFSVKSVSLNRTQIAVYCENSNECKVFFGFYRDSFQKTDTLQKDTVKGARLSCGASGCFILENGKVSSLDKKGIGNIIAESFNSVQDTITHIAVGRNIVFALLESKKIVWAGTSDRFSGDKISKNNMVFYMGMIDIPANEKDVLNIAVLSDDSVLTALTDGKSIEIANIN
ncbi:MAG: hypothetical protein NC340_00390 [Ruminococcus flavefaciens]|nr:hypothetical protein [Ruminococcus flavefaciens]MCM1228570.1 hypothetical protein [Ruminococcus flavefaciens]